jgi:hypothetical protein
LPFCERICQMNDYYSILSTTLQRWQSLAESLPVELWNRRPAQGEWSAAECLVHLMDTERFVFPLRVRAFLAGQDFPAFNPDAQGAKLDPAAGGRELVSQFARLRQESLALLDTLNAADLPRTARHAELGPVTLAQMLNEWAAHDLDHTIQAERAVMQPFIDDCGPWQVYFKANRIQTG